MPYKNRESGTGGAEVICRERQPLIVIVGTSTTALLVAPAQSTESQ
jgi:hypothetical protein